ncbi:GRAM domain-containing protein 2B-like isoform X2 [Siniperca chuatsi]|uniref:GRAM domain-containing protein 2B-like isoform X2 n=1 Tax=Siniperca chuatsi TaxID=119488 RepID=UPI001CE12CAC|nr:GRAM domain-containing protein 2B-like isoform X2 [Siniperca chuatsi]
MVLTTEQADRLLTPLSTPDQVFSKDSRGNRSTLKSVEQLSPMLSPSDCETKCERKKPQPTHLSKTNAHYHKLFKEVSKDELLKQSYTCALQRDILYQGKMFVSDNWICFHSKVFGRDTKISIPAVSVTFIKKTKTALLVPNALVIETTSYQHVFVSFLSRNTTYKLLRSICVHLEVDKTCSSPIISSCDNSFRVKCPSSLPLDFSGDFSDLDGVVQKRRQEMMESSSSGSQTPDYDKITDFTGLPDTFLSAVKSGEVSVHADIHLQTPSPKHGAALKNGSTKPTRGVTLKDKSSQPMSLHAILLIYLFLVSVLVLSSCYMAFKIVALEHRLNSLVSMGEHIRNENAVSHRSQDGLNAEIYGELSTNLVKLEKMPSDVSPFIPDPATPISPPAPQSLISHSLHIAVLPLFPCQFVKVAMLPCAFAFKPPDTDSAPCTYTCTCTCLCLLTCICLYACIKSLKSSCLPRPSAVGSFPCCQSLSPL